MDISIRWASIRLNGECTARLPVPAFRVPDCREPWPPTGVWLKEDANPQEVNVRQNQKKPLARKPAAPETDPHGARKRRNSWEPQVVVPHQVDLPLHRPEHEDVAVPAAPNGRSLINGRL
jgi:hypothetical protein